MSQVVDVSGGARISVATDALAASAAGCGDVASGLRSTGDDLRLLLLRSDAVMTRTTLSAAELATVRTGSALGRVERAADRLLRVRWSLLAAADLYALTEHALATIRREALERTAAAVAPAAPTVLPAVAAAVLIPALIRAHQQQAPGSPQDAEDLLRLVLADRAVVGMVRALSGTVDELALGAVGLPSAASGLLGDDGLGLFGREEAATVLFSLLTVVGPVAESPVSVQRTRIGRATAPTGLGDLVSRVPYGVPEQIRIERFVDAAGQPHATVYLGGTADAPGQPWDMTSNLAAVAGQDAGSVRATEAAMRAAGITADDAVVFVGYSQGGLIASRLAETGEWTTVGIVTAGSPGGPIAAPPGVPVVALEHEEDLVVALGGMDGRSLNEDRTVVVSRSLGADLPDTLLAGHDFGAYRASAALADASTDAALVSVRNELMTTAAAAADGEVEVTMWEARRDPPARRPADRDG